MNWKKKRLKNSRLYIVLDKDVVGVKAIMQTASQIKKCGADIIQFRDKSADKKTFLKNALCLKKLFKRSRTLLIVNDHTDIALLLNCDGVHIGQGDLPIGFARKILGDQKIIGVSCATISQALLAQKQGADYLGIGAVYPTKTKSDSVLVKKSLIAKLKQKIKIPFFVIGGINGQNIDRLISLGADRVAVCEAVCKAGNIPSSIKMLRDKLYKNDPN